MSSLPFQRIGSVSNSRVGSDFEVVAQEYFRSQGLVLQRDVEVQVGVAGVKKIHAFDLGCHTQKVIVECKSHRWTTGHNAPSAKLTVWNEAMLYFLAAPVEYRKILFVLRHCRRGAGESLATYYLRRYLHLVPTGVEFWEYCEETRSASRVGIGAPGM